MENKLKTKRAVNKKYYFMIIEVNDLDNLNRFQKNKKVRGKKLEKNKLYKKMFTEFIRDDA